MITEDRGAYGFVGVRSIEDNIALPNLDFLASNGWLKHKEIEQRSKDIFGKLRIKAPGIETAVGTLSGGNQQKVVLAKWMFNLPDVLILDEPTRGIDVGAKYDIYCIINELAASGKCVLVISSELPELLGVCDRIYVMNEGEIKGEKLVQDATQENIMRLLI